MNIKKTAIAGTLESSDIQIMLSENGGKGVDIILESSVKKQFGDQIEKVIGNVLDKFGITEARVNAVDKGALDCVIKARTITAVQRALEIVDKPNWEVL